LRLLWFFISIPGASARQGVWLLTFDLHQTLTEPGDTLPKMFVFVWSHRGSGVIFDSAEKPSYYFLRFFSLSRQITY